MAVRRINGRFVVEFEQSGSRVFRRLPPAATKAQAVTLETRIRQQLIDQKLLGKRPDVPLKVAIKTWLEEVVKGRKSEDETKSHADQVIPHTEGRSVADVAAAAEDIRRSTSSVDRRGDEPRPLSAGTTNRRLCILKAVAKFAWRKGWTEENLSPKITLLPENNARHVYLSQAQVASLIDKAATAEAKAFIAWGAYTGMRQGEIMGLRADDICDGLARIKDSKIGEPRMVPIVPALQPHVSAIPFKSHKRTLYAAFEAARDAAQIGHCTYHDLRHTTASAMINAGVDLYTVGSILGHKSTQTTKRYAHLSVESKRDALGKTFDPKWTEKNTKGNTGKGRKSKSARKGTSKLGSQSRARKSA